MTLSHCRALRNYGAFATLHEAAEVGFQFYYLHVAVTVHTVYLVAIEQNAEVVYCTAHVDVLPRACCLLANEHLQTVTVDVREDVELPVMIANARCPDALSVCLFMVFEAELVAHVESRQAITGELPVHQVARVQHHKPRQTVHGGACKVIVVAHTYDVRVGKLVIKQGIGIGPVTVIGSPRLRAGRY